MWTRAGWEVGVPLIRPWTTLSPRGIGTGSCGSSGDSLTLLTLNKMIHGCRDNEQPDRLVTIISKCPGYPAQKASSVCTQAATAPGSPSTSLPPTYRDGAVHLHRFTCSRAQGGRRSVHTRGFLLLLYHLGIPGKTPPGRHVNIRAPRAAPQ